MIFDNCSVNKMYNSMWYRVFKSLEEYIRFYFFNKMISDNDLSKEAKILFTYQMIGCEQVRKKHYTTSFIFFTVIYHVEFLLF